MKRREAKVLVQLRTGACQLNDYLYKIKRAESPSCTCGEQRETVEHFLFQCPSWNHIRNEVLIVNRKAAGPLALALGGYKRENYQLQKTNEKWKPPMDVVKATIVAAQSISPQATEITALNKRLKWQNQHADRGLHYIHLDTNNLQLVAFSDSSFANNKDFSSQIGFVITIADTNGNANILHWSSIKCKRVTRSVLASELYAMTHATRSIQRPQSGQLSSKSWASRCP